jgi:transposase-like protein
MFKQVFSLPLSEGTIENILDKVALKCQVVYQQIKTDISQSAVVGADETGTKVSGKKWWIWAAAVAAWQTVLSTFIVASDNRGFKTVEAFFAQGFS